MRTPHSPISRSHISTVGRSIILHQARHKFRFLAGAFIQRVSSFDNIITPYGKFCFNCLPFGISSAPELFQRRMSTTLDSLEGVVCLMDDILIYGKTREEHDKRVLATLERLQKRGITLNKEKCSFATDSVRFLGHIVEKEGVRADLEKVRGIRDLTEPRNLTELQRFLGMRNQLNKFSPLLTDTTKPIRDLLCSRNQWLWGETQQKAFVETKKLLSSTPILSLYD